MRSIPSLAALALAISLPVRALDISGNVLTKLGDPIAGAKVCIKSDPSSCVSTAADGAFHLSKAIAVRRDPGTGDAGFTLAYRRGALFVQSPSAVAVRVEWLSADGRRAWSASEVRLQAGPNALALPAGLPHAGLCILRLSTPDHILTWKAMLAPGLAAGPGAAGSSAPRIAALAKAAAATLEISKTGYRTRSYEPTAETETDATIYLSETSDVGLVYDGTFSQKVVALDHAKKTIITEETDASCDSATNQVVHETVQDTQSYAVRDGQLWTWTAGDCTGTLFTGTASDIVGKWTLVDANALLPEDLRAGCSPSADGGESPYETFSGDYTVTETQVSGTLSAETCPGDYFGFIFSYTFGSDTSIVPTKNTCKQVAFANGKGDTATFDFSKNGDSLHTAYAYKTSPCAFDMDFGLTQKDPACPEGLELAAFLTCLRGSGFAQTGAAAKTSAALPARLPMSLERRARPAVTTLPKGGWLAPLRHAGRGEEYISRIWKAAPTRK
jgi:hypothetical protein